MQSYDIWTSYDYSNNIVTPPKRLATAIKAENFDEACLKWFLATTNRNNENKLVFGDIQPKLNNLFLYPNKQ